MSVTVICLMNVMEVVNNNLNHKSRKEEHRKQEEKE